MITHKWIIGGYIIATISAMFAAIIVPKRPRINVLYDVETFEQRLASLEKVAIASRAWLHSWRSLSYYTYDEIDNLDKALRALDEFKPEQT